VRDIESLAEMGCYERVNQFMGLLQVSKLRRLVARLAGRGVVLDAGSGPGYTARELCLRGSRVILLDPSSKMNEFASRLLDSAGCRGRYKVLKGVFEDIPLPPCSVDAATATFSLRDAIDRRRAVEELARVIKPGGRLVVLDLYRPSAPLERVAVSAYLLLIPPLGAALTLCPRAMPLYLGLHKTLGRMESRWGMELLLGEFFERVESMRVMPGTAIWVAENPKVGCT
jgi:ubiquinone/menaquinone biosynthesis C-methylase UbiE